MAINLQKGQRENINAPKFTIGLGWDINNTSTGGAFDLDASLFLLGDNKKLVSDNHFIFYNNLLFVRTFVKNYIVSKTIKLLTA